MITNLPFYALKSFSFNASSSKRPTHSTVITAELSHLNLEILFCPPGGVYAQRTRCSSSTRHCVTVLFIPGTLCPVRSSKCFVCCLLPGCYENTKLCAFACHVMSACQPALVHGFLCICVLSRCFICFICQTQMLYCQLGQSIPSLAVKARPHHHIWAVSQNVSPSQADQTTPPS